MSNLATITNNILADSGIDDINVIVSTGSYANPAWITSLAWTKITGAPSGIVTGTGTTNYLPKFTGSTTIGNSAIHNSTSFVAINNTAGGVYALDIFSSNSAYNTRLYQPSSDTSTYTSLIIQGAMTSVSAYFGIGGSTTGNTSFRDSVVIGSQSSHPLVFNTADAERMEIFTDGNVSISNSPSNAGFKLDVNGTGRFSAASTDYALTLQNIQDDSQGLLVRATDNDGSLYLIRAQSSNSSTSQTWVDRFTLAKNGAATFSSSVTATNALFNSTSTQLILQNTDGGTNAERIGMFMTGGDTFKILSLNDNNTTRVDNIIVANVLSGNVGIGTASPTNPLHIVSNTLSQLNIQALSGNTNAQINLEPSGTGIALIGPANNVDLAFRTNASIKLRLDKDGNLGLGVTPSAWNSAYKAFQFGTTGALFGESGDAANYFTTNTFVDAVGFKYITSDWAIGYFQENGVHSWRTAPSGTAGNAISFTQAMTLFSTGNLLVGTPSPISDNGARLQVSGNVTTTGNIAINNSGLTAAYIGATSSQGFLNLYSGTSSGYNNGANITLVSSDRSGAFTRGEIYIEAGNASNNTANGFIQMLTGNSPRMTITSAGDFVFKGRSTTTNYEAVFYNDNSQLAINANNTSVGKTINFNVRNDQNAMTIASGGSVTINNLSGSGNRIVVANSGGTLISAVIGSGLAFDGTTLTATGGGSGSISGSGTSGTVALFTGATSIGNSAITQSGSNVTFSGGINPTKTAKNTYAIQIRGALYGAPRLQVYDLAADPNGYMGLGTDMSGAPYEFSNYFPRTGGNGKWSVGSWAGDFGTGQYVSGYNEKLFIVESAAQFNVALTVTSSVSVGDFLRLTKASSVDIQAYTGSAYSNLNYDAASHNWQTSGGTAKMVLNSSGNVGIGTITPATRFHVESASVSYGQLRFLNTSSSGETSINIGRTNQTLEQRWTIGQGVAGIGDSFGFYTGGSSRVNLQTNGNFLIGTTADNGNRLRVDGTIWSDSSITATSFFESSDATLKTLVEDNYQAKGIDSVIAKLYIKNGKEELGYFAQDLQDVLPSAVSRGSDGLLNLSYREVHTAKIAYLEEEIKQLKKKYENN
jgi:hypothetical protein